MRSVESILVALDRKRNAKRVVAKAVVLARCLGARLELFIDNAECAYVQSHQYDSSVLASARESCLAESRTYLEEMWRSLAVNDVKVRVDAACESPGYEAIVRKVRQCLPDLVIRGTDEGARGAGRVLDAGDWDLVRTCPAPLLLTCGTPWKSSPAIAAAVDISGEETPALTRAILRAASQFATNCGGAVDVIYAHSLEHASPEMLDSDRAVLAERAREADVESSGLFVIGGEPARAIPQFAARHGYDLLVLGALTHRKAPTALVGTLTGQLIETLDADILLVKPPAYRSPVR